MIVNGSNAKNVDVWKQTISVTPNTEYEFSAWCVNIFKKANWEWWLSDNENPAKLEFYINGAKVGMKKVGSRGDWQKFTYTWNSGNSSTATIQIQSRTRKSIGDDFGLDDISLKRKSPAITQCTKSVAVKVNIPCEPFNINITGSLPSVTEDGFQCFTICPQDATANHQLDLHATGTYPNSSTAPGRYLQSDATSTFEWHIADITTTGQDCSFTPTTDMEGNGYYGRLQVTDAHGCSNTAFIRIKVSKSPVTNINVTNPICHDGEISFETGTEPSNDIQVTDYNAQVFAAKQGVSKKIFLPDGASCNGSCDYNSPVEFNCFQQDATVESVNDIEYLRLNIEHSCIGDLVIKLSCPNGQTATVLRQGWTDNAHVPSPECENTVDPTDKGWYIDYYSIRTDEYRNHFGFTGRYSNGNDPCNPNDASNQAGTGWNYCWSDNTGSEYHYNSGTWVYAQSNHIANYIEDVGEDNFYNALDSSNVAAKTNFFHPDENFNALVGCPLNGEWTITVQDGALWDNGYLFEWELMLSDEKALQDWEFNTQWQSTTVTGEGMQTDGITAKPTTIGEETYNIEVLDNHGCEYNYDKTITIKDYETDEQWITVLRSAEAYDFAMFSAYSDKFKNIDISATTADYRVIKDTAMSLGDCGTILILNLKVTEDPCEHIYKTSTPQTRVCSNDAVLTAQGMTNYTWSAEPECADLIGQEHNTTIYVTPTVNTTFYVVGSYTNAEGNVISCPDKGLGVDVIIKPIDHTDIELDTNICQNDYDAEITANGKYMWRGIEFTDANINQIVTESCFLPNGCKELLKMKLTVNPSYDNTSDIDTIVSCETPYIFTQGDVTETFNNSEIRAITLKSIYGCDSIVKKHVIINKDLTNEKFHIDCSMLPDIETGTVTQSDQQYTFVLPTFPKAAITHYLKNYYSKRGTPITVTYSPNPATFGVGTHTITWTATDLCGNSASCTQDVTVKLEEHEIVCPNAVDNEGNVYPSVLIDGNCWTQKNLLSKRYDDNIEYAGTIIPDVYTYESAANPNVVMNEFTYGNLYTWEAATGNGLPEISEPDANGHIQGICPEGWYLPTAEQYATLCQHGKEALRTSEYWIDGGGTNTTMFSALPAGYYDGGLEDYRGLGAETHFWSTTMVEGTPQAHTSSILYYCNEPLEDKNVTQGLGYSVRCIKK